MNEILEVKRVDGHLAIDGYRQIPDVNTESSIDIQGPTEIVAAHFHMRDHPEDDGLVRAEEYPYIALARGIHELIPTGHNSVRGLVAIINEVERRSLPLKITRAVESEAHEDGHPKHVLVLNPEEVSSPGKTVIDTNRFYHRQGPNVLTIGAHPGMGRYSVGIDQIEHIQTNGYDPDQKFDGIELNGASAKAYQFGKRWYVRPFRPLVAELPSNDLNQEVLKYAKKNGTLLFKFGGGDGHFGKKDIDDMLMVRSASKTTTQALKEQEVIIFLKEDLIFPHVDYVRKHVYIIFGK